ncbi:phosphoribosyl-AMP cyclohydrolase [Leptospira idonii]|uniref:phosphoribosyl-AMP cyclohydrolase n=2 Tax=Leptospira idonii TaxID=1193500 RepID=A0A4R9LVN1_9LEPT|nr:phosphoribosyl-AMP cyclohydrolase [Leptospira idonii]
MTNGNIKTDSWTSIWKSGSFSVDAAELESLLEKAPDMFPFLALDENDKELMLAWGKISSLREAIVSGHGTYYSRSRNKPWVKGEESGHLQNLNEILISLDPFYVLYKTKQIGAACHTGYYSCFFRQILSNEEVKFVYKDKVEGLK